MAKVCLTLAQGVAKIALPLRVVLCKRAFAHILDRGRLRRTWLRGRDNVAKRHLVHVAARNLALVIRGLTDFGTPKAAAEAARGGLFYLHAGDADLLILFVILAASCSATAVFAIAPDTSPLSTGC